MIIRQTTTIIFEYPQDYLQEQEWCKTKDDRWVHKGTDTLGAVYENQISYSIGVSADRKTENSSVFPNNCETCKHNKLEWYSEECDGCSQAHSNYEPQIIACPINERAEYWFYEDEPQTCSVNGRPYSECADCEYFKCTADEPQAERSK